MINIYFILLITDRFRSEWTCSTDRKKRSFWIVSCIIGCSRISHELILSKTNGNEVNTEILSLQQEFLKKNKIIKNYLRRREECHGCDGCELDIKFLE